MGPDCNPVIVHYRDACELRPEVGLCALAGSGLADKEEALSIVVDTARVENNTTVEQNPSPYDQLARANA